VVDAFILSPGIEAKQKYVTIEQLSRDFERLALNRCGSFVLEKMFAVASMRLKKVMVTKIAPHITKLSTSSGALSMCVLCI
jgi:hypothetical protein